MLKVGLIGNGAIAGAHKNGYRKLVEEAPEVEGYEAALISVGAASPFDENSFKTIEKLFK